MPPSTPDLNRTETNHRRDRQRRLIIVLALAVAAGLAAAMAPVTLTGSPTVDAIERALIVGITTFVGAHAHRWTWFLVGALAAVPARGFSLVLISVGLVVALSFTWAPRRSRPAGAAAVGLITNGVFWYGADTLPMGASHAIGGTVVLIAVGTGLGLLHQRHRQAIIGVLGLTTLVLLVGTGLAGYLALASRSDITSGTASARGALEAVRRGESAVARSSLANAQLHLRRAHDQFNGPLASIVSLVPGLAQQVDAVGISVEEALAVSDGADELVRTDYEQLRYQGRIDVARVLALLPQSEHIHAVLAEAEDRLDGVASRSLLPPLRDRVEEFSSQVRDAREDADLARQLLRVAPGLFGQGGTRRYLVVLMTPAELRGSGGLAGNWVELQATRGDLIRSQSGRIGELNAAVPAGQRTIDRPADYIERYGRFEPTDNLQDVTFSPNWASDASVYAQLYPQSGGRPVDGVIGIDPTGLAGLLELSGPVALAGPNSMELTARNAVSLLTRDQYILFGNDTEAREQFLESAVRVTFDRLTAASLPAPRRLGEVLGPLVRARHIQLWSPASAEQDLFEALHADGRVAVPRGQDGLAVVQQNVGNNKIDAYLRRTVEYEATINAAKATIDATVRITLRNEVPSLDLPTDVVGNDRGVPVGTNLMSLAVYTPHRLISATIDGRAVILGSGSELGLRAWDTPLLSVPPGGAVTVELRLKGVLDLRSAYRFRYLPQPMATPEDFQVSVGIRSGRFSGEGPSQVLHAEGPADEPVVLQSGVSG